MLFDATERESDHVYFQKLKKPTFRPDIVAWCEATYERARNLLDSDFPTVFRRETPQRISELLFSAAFLDAGWQPLDRIPGFDLAFQMENGRLLVEITTPEPHSSDTWTEVRKNGITLYRADENTMDAALRRLTSSFATKASKIRERCEKGDISKSDYIVIAISGFRLNQETPFPPEIGGPVPDFAKAFLPIGAQYVNIQIGNESNIPSGGGWKFKPTIDQAGKNPVDRDFFLRPEFNHIHAVAYTPLRFSAPICPIMECEALHNPMACAKDRAVPLRLGSEYGVEVGENEFSIGPLSSIRRGGAEE